MGLEYGIPWSKKKIFPVANSKIFNAEKSSPRRAIICVINYEIHNFFILIYVKLSYIVIGGILEFMKYSNMSICKYMNENAYLNMYSKFWKVISNCKIREKDCLFYFIYTISFLKVWDVSLNMYYFQNKTKMSLLQAPKQDWFRQPLGQLESWLPGDFYLYNTDFVKNKIHKVILENL